MGCRSTWCRRGQELRPQLGAAAAGDTLLRMSREGWQVFGRQIADSRTTRAYREEVACCGAATITLPQTSSVCAVRRDGHQIICSTSLHVGRAACQRSLPSSPITEQDIGRAAAKQQSPWRVLRRVPSAADDAADERESRPCAALAFVSRIWLFPWAGRPK